MCINKYFWLFCFILFVNFSYAFDDNKNLDRDSLAKELGLQILERRITRDEVYIADEAFFTGTAAEVLPIRSLDGRTIGGGSRGPITEKIQSAYFDQVRGNRSVNEEWHTLVK